MTNDRITIDMDAAALRILHDTTESALISHKTNYFADVPTREAGIEKRTQTIHERAMIRAADLCAKLPEMVMAAASTARVELSVLQSAVPEFKYNPTLRDSVMTEQWDEENEIAEIIANACKSMPGVILPGSTHKFHLRAERRTSAAAQSHSRVNSFNLVITWYPN